MMVNREQAEEIAKEYLDKNKLEIKKIIEVKDKIFKWVVETESSEGIYIVEVLKSEGVVIGFEKVLKGES